MNEGLCRWNDCGSACATNASGSFLQGTPLALGGLGFMSAPLRTMIDYFRYKPDPS